jgi:hypothetical protein
MRRRRRETAKIAADFMPGQKRKEMKTQTPTAQIPIKVQGANLKAQTGRLAIQEFILEAWSFLGI